MGNLNVTADSVATGSRPIRCTPPTAIPLCVSLITQSMAIFMAVGHMVNFVSFLLIILERRLTSI